MTDNRGKVNIPKAVPKESRDWWEMDDDENEKDRLLPENESIADGNDLRHDLDEKEDNLDDDNDDDWYIR
jgi:chromosome condensin MukBEF MukE localization factor